MIAGSIFFSPETFPSIVKVRKFNSLAQGWHYGEGGPISRAVIESAEIVIRNLAEAGFTKTDVFPNEGGEVLVTAYHLEHYIGIAVDPSGNLALNYEIDGHQESYNEEINFLSLKQILKRISRTVWNISGSSTRGNSTTIWGGSTIWRSRRLRGVAECQSSKWTALKPVAA